MPFLMPNVDPFGLRRRIRCFQVWCIV